MYEVESILNKRINPITKMLEYQVKWTGYSSKETTWEPERNLVFVRNLIDKYNQRNAISGEPVQIVELPQSKSGILGRQVEKVEQIKKPQNLYSTYKIDSDDDEDYASRFSQFYQQPQENSAEISRSNFNIDDISIGIKQTKIQKVQKIQKIQKELSGFQEQSKKNIKNMQQNLSKNQNQMKINPSSQKINNIQGQSGKQKINSSKLQKQIFTKTKKIEKTEKPINNFKQEVVKGFSRKNKSNQLFAQNGSKSKLIDPSSVGYRAPDTFPTYRKETMNEIYGLHRKPITYEETLSRLKRYPDKAVYSGYDTTFQSFPSPYNLPANLFKTEPVSQKTQTLHYKPYYDQEEQDLESVYQTYNNCDSAYLPGFNDISNNCAGNYGGGEVIVYEIVQMVKGENGMCYLAQTNQGQIWLQRHEIVPKFSTQLCKFYEKNMVFDD